MKYKIVGILVIYFTIYLNSHAFSDVNNVSSDDNKSFFINYFYNSSTSENIIISKSSCENGYSWDNMKYETKEMYIDGIMSGINLFTNESMKQGTNESSMIKFVSISKSISPNNTIVISDIVDEINLFYKQPLNHKIPIVEAYRYSIKKYHGSKPNVLENMIANLRKLYNN